jgi:transposase
MEILEAFDLTRSAESAAELAGCDPKTVRHYVARRDAGLDPTEHHRRARLTDEFVDKIEELVGRSEAKVRADVVHERIVAMGFSGDERTTRRAVAEAKAAWRAGNRRPFKPWVPEPGLWLQFDWGEGPRVRERRTSLFCAWLAWSRFRVVIPTWDKTLGSLLACIDQALRRIGGVPTYLLSDNEHTLTVDRVAGVAVRHPTMVAAGHHYGCVINTCEPADPQSKGGSESTVKIAKWDLVPTSANLRDDYESFASVERAANLFCEKVNGRRHRETGRVPTEMLEEERAQLHNLPGSAFTAALGQTRRVENDQTVRWSSVRYSTPPGHVGAEVWCRVNGDELVIVGRTDAGLAEIARHGLSTPGRPQIVDEHYPSHPRGNGPHPPKIRPRSAEELAFVAIGSGAERWLVEAGASGAQRVRTKMVQAVELAALFGADVVDRALGLAAIAGRFDDGDLVSIIERQRVEDAAGQAVAAAIAEDGLTTQPGTSAWEQMR